MLPYKHAGSEIIARTAPNLFDLAVALVSGIAGAYAIANESVAKTVAGVAIAVALVPPLCVAGIGLGWADLSMSMNAGLLFLTNLAGIAFGAVITFWIMGYAPLRIAKKGMGYTLAFLLLLSIPLNYALQGMLVHEAAARQLENRIITLTDGTKMQLKGVHVTMRKPMIVNTSLVMSHFPTQAQMQELKANLEKITEKEIEVKVSVLLGSGLE